MLSWDFLLNSFISRLIHHQVFQTFLLPAGNSLIAVDSQNSLLQGRL